MNIAVYQPRVSYFVGGGEIVPLQQAKYLSLLGHKVTIITTRASFIRPSEYFLRFIKNNHQIRIKYINLPNKLKWIYDEKPGTRWIRWDYESLYVGRLALAYFIKNKFDIVVVHNYLDILAIPIGHKSVLHLHGYPTEFNYMHELLVDIPTVLVADSFFIKSKWKTLSGIKKIQMATNGIDGEYFKSDYTVSTKYDILYIGRLIKTKGVSYLLEAVSKLKQKSLRIAIAGTGPELKSLKKMIKDKKIIGNIKFLGHINDAELVKLYQSSLMVVLPSYEREGILTTMLEAAACGRPVITTYACSMSEFLKNDYNGLLVAPQNSATLAKAIKKLYQDKKLADKLGRQARRLIETSWNWQKKIKLVEKIYAQTLRNY